MTLPYLDSIHIGPHTTWNSNNEKEGTIINPSKHFEGQKHEELFETGAGSDVNLTLQTDLLFCFSSSERQVTGESQPWGSPIIAAPRHTRPLYDYRFLYILDSKYGSHILSPLNAELNPICHLLELVGAHHIMSFASIGRSSPYSVIC